MSYFYGWLKGNKGATTRQATQLSGMTSTIGCFNGVITTKISYDERTNTPRFAIYLSPHPGKSGGKNTLLAEGVLDSEATTQIKLLP